MDTTTRKALDKFYTSDKAARTFIELIKKHVDLNDFDNIIEPSAGSGALLNHLPSRAIGVDLEPERDDIIKSDFFDYTYPTGKTITVGNPPFGNRSKLAIDFFNRAAEYSDVIAFIIPVTWEKYSIHKQLAEGWALRASERLPEASFVLGGKPHQVRCCMQLWVRGEARKDSLRKTEAEPSTHPDFIIKQGLLPDAEFVIRGVRPQVSTDLSIFDRIDPSTRYYSVVPLVDGVKEVFDRVWWSKYWQGTSMPTVSISDCIEVYNKEKQHGCNPA